MQDENQFKVNNYVLEVTKTQMQRPLINFGESLDEFHRYTKRQYLQYWQPSQE